MSLALYIPMANDATDKSSNNRNGTVLGATFVDNSGVRKGSYNFINNTDRITTPSFAFNNGNLSFSMWVKCSIYSSALQRFFTHGNSGAGVKYCSIMRGQNTNHLLVSLSKSNGDTLGFNIPFNNFWTEDNTWIHIGVAINYATKAIYVYKNGNSFGNTTTVNTITFPDNNVVKQLGTYNGGAQVLKGNLCEVKIIEDLWSFIDFKNEYMLMKGILHN